MDRQRLQTQAIHAATRLLELGERAGSARCGHWRRLLMLRELAQAPPPPGYDYPPTWDAAYATRMQRGLGIVSLAEQERLRTSRVAIIGCGGGGGPLALQLLYAGCRQLTIVDHDRIELSNLNRQVYTQADIGRYKAEALGERLRAIDPLVDLRVHTCKATPANFAELLADAVVVMAAMDDPLSVLLCERYCRSRDIPMLYGWMLPNVLAFWFTRETPSYEELIGIHGRTKAVPSETLAAGADWKRLVRRYEYVRVARLPSVDGYLRPEEIGTRQMLTGGGLRTIAPVVWMAASFFAFEVIFTGLLHRKPFRQEFCGFDYLHMRAF